MAYVTLSNVRKVYDGKVVAVEGVNLTIAEGEFVVLVGPSGCGKSTTLRMIAGLEAITEGEISIAGRVVNDLHPKDRGIAMVFQNYALYPHMTVRKNLAFGLMLRKLPRAEINERVEKAASFLGLGKLLDRKPKALSGGQRQRVALGRALVREPKVFLFDEPLSNLDAKLRVTTRTEIKNLHQRLKTTTIYVTHDQEEAMTLGDRIVVMSDGHIQQVDTPLHIYRAPANRFVASFLGSPPMNFVDGALKRTEHGVWFVAPEEPGLRLRIPDARAARVRAFKGAGVVLGFRPSAMSEEPTGKFAAPAGLEQLDNAITLTTGVVEPLGEKIDVSCTSEGGRPLLARVDAREDFPIGESVTFYLDPDHMHIFEPGEFGSNLTRNE